MRLIVSLEDLGFINRLSDGRYTLASEVVRLNTIYQDALDLERHVDANKIVNNSTRYGLNKGRWLNLYKFYFI